MNLSTPASALLGAAGCWLALTAPAGAQGALFLGSEGGVGAVTQASAGGAVPVPGLAGIRLLPVDFSGRTPLETFLPGRPRRSEEVPQAARLALPGGQGSLYRFERGDGSGGGFLLVPPSGPPRALIEAPAPAPGQHPFLERVAVDPSGQSLLVASVLGAGGDLFELQLASGLAQPRTASLPPQSWSGDGLLLADGFGAASGAAGIFRFARQPGAQASAVPFEGQPPFFAAPLVLSGDRKTAAALAGSAPNAARLYTFQAAGGAAPAHAGELPIGGAGFSGETWFGPYLALSEDGSHAAFTIETPLSRELFLTRTAQAPAPIQLTGDETYLDTLDEIGLLRFVPGSDRLLYAVGTKAPPDPGQPGLAFERVDFYTAELLAPNAPPSIQNLSVSSGDAQAPFTVPSTLSPDSGVYLLPDGQTLVLHDAKSERLLRVAPGFSAAEVLAAEIKSLDAVAWDGVRLLLSLRTEPQSGPRRQLLSALVPGQPLQTLASLPDGTQYLTLTPGAPGQLALQVDFFGQRWLARLDAQLGSASLAFPTPVPLGPTLAFDPAGNLRASLSNSFWPGLHFLWQTSGSLALELYAASPSFVLP